MRCVSLAALAAVLILCSSAGCAQPATLTILHTNDMHAGFLPHEAGWVRESPKPLVGGFRELAATVDSIRKAKGEVLLLDAGDVMTGTPISEYDYRGALGGALFELMNRTGYDAWEIGNHDLDISQDNLRRLTQIAAFPTLSANLTDSAGTPVLNNKPYVIISKKGLRIGVIGLMTTDLYNVTNTNNLTGLKVAPITPVMQKYIDEIAPRTDLLVALTHEGVEDDSMLAATTHGLNVIIGGHSHTRLKAPKVVNGVIICQTGANCENLGELDLTVEQHKVTAFDGKLITLWARGNRPPDPVAAFIDSFRTKLDAEYGQVLGTLSEDWKRSRSGESNIGTFIAEALREAGHADIGVTNSSGIRKDISAGPIRKLDLFEISPFRNILCTFPMSGREVRELVLRYLRSTAEGRTSIDLAGIECTWKRGSGDPTIVSIAVGGKELSDGAVYRCATSDFVVNQKEKYLGRIPGGVTYEHATIAEALVEQVKRSPSVNAALVRHFHEQP